MYVVMPQVFIFPARSHTLNLTLIFAFGVNPAMEHAPAAYVADDRVVPVLYWQLDQLMFVSDIVALIVMLPL